MPIGNVLNTIGVNLNTGSVIGLLAFFIILFCCFIVMGLSGYVIYIYFFIHNIKATIFEKRGGTWRSWTDRIKVYKTKTGNEFMRLFHAKQTIAPVDPEKIGFTKRGKPHVILTKFGRNYVAGSASFNSPVKINLTEEALDIDMFLSLETENKQVTDVVPILMKHLPIILQFGGLMIIAFILIFVLDYSGDALASANGMMSSVANTVASAIKAAPPTG